MKIKKNLKFLKDIPCYKFSNVNIEEIKNNYIEKRSGKILNMKYRLNLSYTKDKEKNNQKTELFYKNSIKSEANSNQKKKIIPLLNTSGIILKTKNNTKFFNKRNFSLNNIKPKYYILSENNMNNKTRDMSKGELTEMIYGKIIKFGYKLDFDIEENRRIKEILYNKPKFIIDLIEYGKVGKNEINDFFNLESFNISWNENLEKAYRQIRKTNSNIFKIISFISKTGLMRKLKQNFELKNFINFYDYNKEEIEATYDTYQKLKKYEHKKLKEAFEKIDDIYIIRDMLLKEKISNIRKEYYSNKIKKYKENKKLEIDIKEIAEKRKVELIDIKNCIFHVRQNTNWKIFPYKKINRLKFSKSITKYNEIIQKEINIKSIKAKDKIKKEKIYIKEKINILKRKKIILTKNFNWNNFLKKNNENKKIIEYFVINIQSHFRGHMLKLFLSKLIRGTSTIIINLYKYTKFKQLIIKMYKMTFKIIDNYIKNNDPYFRLNINNIKQVLKIMMKYCRTRKLIFKENEVKIINKIIDSNIGFLQIKENQEIYSNILLINLCKYLTYFNIN